MGIIIGQAQCYHHSLTSIASELSFFFSLGKWIGSSGSEHQPDVRPYADETCPECRDWSGLFMEAFYGLRLILCWLPHSVGVLSLNFDKLGGRGEILCIVGLLYVAVHWLVGALHHIRN